MAEANFEDFGAAAPALRAGQTQRLINLAGGATSVALMLGLAIWGYRLAVRDVNGIPVIHAMEGPMRMTPEDPGGQIADNLGLTVNRVAADALGQPSTDKLVLAPHPIELTPQDVAPDARVAAAAATPAAAPVAPPNVSAPTASAPAPLADQSPAPVTAEVTASVAAAPPVPTTPAPDTVAPAPVVAATDHAAPLTSPRPMARPKAIAAIVPVAATGPAAKAAAPAAKTPTPTPPPPPPESVDAAALVKGTRLVQLGAFDSPDVATSSWALLKARFGDLLADKSRVVQKATSGGRDFYRLRAFGFKDDAEARRFCAELDAANAPCVPVIVR